MFIGAPRSPGTAFELHPNALKQELVWITPKVEDAFHAQKILAEFGDLRPEPNAQLHAVQFDGFGDAHCHDILKVVMMPMTMVIMVVPVMTMVTIVVRL